MWCSELRIETIDQISVFWVIFLFFSLNKGYGQTLYITYFGGIPTNWFRHNEKLDHSFLV